MDYVTLANGEKVEWDEFSKWSSHKQTISLRPKEIRDEIRKKISKARRESLSNGTFTALKGATHRSSKKVISPDGEFPSLREAAIFYSVKSPTVSAWIKRGKAGFKFGSSGVTIRDGKHLNSKKLRTPIGVFQSISAAARSYGVSRENIRNKLLSKKHSDFYFLGCEENLLE